MSKRYDFDPGMDGCAEPAADGEWVRYEDCEALKKELAECKKQVEQYRLMCLRAAHEISEHWDAHCDEDGGPCNLLYRLEGRTRPDWYYGMDHEYRGLVNENKGLRADLAQVKAELEVRTSGQREKISELRAELARVKAEFEQYKENTYCAYCGHIVQRDDVAGTKITEHIKMCPKHPMRELEAELARVKAEVPCPECGGAGYECIEWWAGDYEVSRKKCPTCNGTGRKYQEAK